MSRYFFNFRQGDSYAADDIGCDFDSPEQAYLAAFQAAQEMWGDLLASREDPLLCAFEITDRAGEEIFELPFQEVLDACRGTRSVTPLKSHHEYFRGAMETHRRARQLMSEVSTALSTARMTLCETTELLAEASKIGC